MFSASFDFSHRFPLDFDTDRTARVADAPLAATGESRTEAPPSDAESLLTDLGFSGHVARAIASERSAPGAWE